jgi:hypothetical protein
MWTLSYTGGVECTLQPEAADKAPLPVELRIRADDRADLAHPAKGPGVQRVERCDHFEPLLTTRPRDRIASTHAEADRAHPLGIYLRHSGQGIKRRLQSVEVDVIVGIQEAFCEVAKHADRHTATGEQIRGKRNVSCPGELIGHIANVVRETEDLVDDDQAGERSGALGHRQMTLQGLRADRNRQRPGGDLLPRRGSFKAHRSHLRSRSPLGHWAQTASRRRCPRRPPEAPAPPAEA